MRRLHVISHPEHEMGGEIYYRESDFMHNPELHEAYKCGYKHGRKEAYKEIMEEQYGDSYHHREHGRTYPPMMRETDRGWRQPEDDEVMYRRRMNGRFY